MDKIIKSGLGLLLLLLPGMCWPQMGGPALVKVAIASVKDMASVTMVPGTVVSRNDARLSAEVPGRLTMVAGLLPDHAERRRRLADMQPDLAW